ncbi:olfactory receptor 6N2-like [Boleophthalmus pectinirostris]|uniref:olfactory receptor 6N2-like n=1 Tax=Boleophthalmus pectinirostris TaxID=150288 RepID=UPI00242A70C4|nr:olfactory receptor 6N2-like [Boleophthalmus pectinirostris]
MDNGSDPAYITVEGYIDLQTYGPLYFVIMLVVYISVICSNSLIMYVIWKEPNLHEPMYFFISALSFNSLLFSSTVYPKLLIDLLSEKQVIPYKGCLFQWFSYYNLVGSEFLLLASMAYDRFVSICKPLQYLIIMRNSKMCVFLGFAWFFPVCHTIFPYAFNYNKKLCTFHFRGIICNSTVYRLFCVSSPALSIFGMIIFTNVVILPVLFILYTYSRIFHIVKRSKEMRKKAFETCMPHLVVMINFAVFSAYDVLLVRIEMEFPKPVRFFVSLQMIIYHPLLNPLIYGLKMKEISKYIKKLLCPLMVN